ncbi:helix-turn-helix domain-containing protein [Winogradskyella ursingii]|uniref:helix-turn-helix domain-containing protein n=1 Tax=Winogradskyella ursingii TaxID=2686079 RepID=UPI0015C910E2|nr:AraC family transcriptional regulator [Winogradskyella ursingii]
MELINIDLSINQPVLEQINHFINGDLKKLHNEQTLKFNNHLGKGTIRNIIFEWGIALIDYDVLFKTNVKFNYNLSSSNPIEFIFVSEGNLSYASEKKGDNQELLELQRYQNIILSNLPKSQNIFSFPAGQVVKLNVIQVFANDNSEKSGNSLDKLQNSLRSILDGKETNLPYKYLGNYNLKLAEIIETLNNEENEGIVRFLNIEGQINLILALQILEHKSFENKLSLPNSISKEDLLKTKLVSDDINQNLQKSYTIAELAKKYNFSAKKMQLGFKLLYNQSVNEYIRLKKLDLAQELIKNTDLSISEIVYRIGYKSRSYFSKIFFEKYNILPVKYKELIKEGLIASEKE